MCGFSGIISPNTVSSELILKSIKAIKHRGPDDSLLFAGDGAFYSCDLSSEVSQQRLKKLYSNSFSDLYLGFNRLSIVDLSENGMQPFYDEQTGMVFMLNGEVYNYADLRQKFLLEEPFQSQTDSEVAFRLYLKLGDDFVQQLRGMFSIVLYDFKTKRLKAWRDRLGMKPFYYALVNGTFVFSSEMKGIFATGLIQQEYNYQGLAYSMYLSTCPSPLTIYQQINSLQAGHFLAYSTDSLQIVTSPYWRLKYSPTQKKIDFEEFNRDMEEICRLHQIGDVEKALMLSGGMDSGTLAYYFSKFDSHMRCLNIFAKNHSIDEREFALENANNAHLNVSFIEIPNNPSDAEKALYLSSEEEPNSSPEAALFLCEKAKKMNIKVLYNALGPDEIFGGYPYFSTIKRIERFQFLKSIIPAFLLPKRYRRKFSELKNFGTDCFPLISRQLFSWDEISNFLAVRNQEIPSHPIDYIKNQIIEIYPEFKHIPLLKRVSYLEIFYYISSHHTFRSDQPSMRHSIEMRFPFLDHFFVEKYFNQLDTFCELNKNLKPQFRNFVTNILPEKIFKMRKKGFSMPTDQWISSSKDGINKFDHPEKIWYMKMLNFQKK